ncbi:MAG TPA: radical SAM protein [Candidatus Absconditabacterales bacterium]|nr:radical SAM protein [Candidatus Absconditabacterales bacterium]
MQSYHDLILKIIELNTKQKLTIDDLKTIKRDFAKQKKLADIPTNIKLLRAYHQLIQDKKIKKDIEIENLLKKRSVRSESGIVAVQVLTKPYACPGQCIFCPNEKGMPKSYISTEPGAMRAALNQFDPIKQTYNRLLSLTMTGHQTDKIEMIVLGGTWDVYPKDYKIEFIKKLYDACNTFSQLEINLPEEGDKKNKIKILIKKIRAFFKGHKYITNQKFQYDITNLNKIKYSSSLQEAIKINETADNRIIGLTIETRPEFVTDENCQSWRELGVTRLEIGIQSMYDDVLQANKRGHSIQQIRDAIHKLRQYGFKFSVHIMPGLYKSNYKKDLGTFQKIYSDPFVKPDEIKFYPTSVIPNTKLYDLYSMGKYKPLTISTIKKLIKETFQDIIPPYTRIKRLIRDIPSTEIAAGSNITNLAQLTHNELKKELKSNKKKREELYSRLYGDYQLFNSAEEFLTAKKQSASGSQINAFIIGQDPDVENYRNFVTLDTRSREIRNKLKVESGKLKDVVNLVIRQYQSSVGTEYFISFEDLQGYLYGFTRLLLPTKGNTVQRDGLGPDTAMIRELHIYGQLASLKSNTNSKSKQQHKGFGGQLMSLAEQISQRAGYQKLSVISGVGVRGYYEKIGYSLEGTYMVKIIGNG